jgi:hypothetical protein
MCYLMDGRVCMLSVMVGVRLEYYDLNYLHEAQQLNTISSS